MLCLLVLKDHRAFKASQARREFRGRQVLKDLKVRRASKVRSGRKESPEIQAARLGRRARRVRMGPTAVTEPKVRLEK